MKLLLTRSSFNAGSNVNVINVGPRSCVQKYMTVDSGIVEEVEAVVQRKVTLRVPAQVVHSVKDI